MAIERMNQGDLSFPQNVLNVLIFAGEFGLNGEETGKFEVVEEAPPKTPKKKQKTSDC